MEFIPAQLAPVDIDDRIVRMEFPVGVFIGLLNPGDVFHNIHRADGIQCRF